MHPHTYATELISKHAYKPYTYVKTESIPKQADNHYAHGIL